MGQADGIVDVFLGGKSCFCGSISNANPKSSLFVDFKANLHCLEPRESKVTISLY